MNNNYEIISLGHRNPQGLYYHSNLNYLFSTEHGPNGGDEINKIKGKQSKEIETLLGYLSKTEVIHKDDMVLL